MTSTESRTQNQTNELTAPAPAPVSHRYLRYHRDPIKHAHKIAGVLMERDPGTGPGEPVRVAIDRSTIEHMGWLPRDAITLVPIFPEMGCSEGKLIIRKARPGEIAFLLGELPGMAESDSEGIDPAEVHGPEFEWCFPTPWVETYFPGRYDDEYHDFNSATDRWWLLTDILGQAGQIELTLGPEELFLYLQRTSPVSTTLDLHLPPGLLHLKGWSLSTPLVLESAANFDAFATEDVLTIRENCLGEEPNLVRAANGFKADVHPLWLDRFFPEYYDASSDEELDDPWSSIDSGPGDAFSPGERDTFIVGYSTMVSKGHKLSFKITPPLA
jgi:hypothetical protein